MHCSLGTTWLPDNAGKVSTHTTAKCVPMNNSVHMQNACGVSSDKSYKIFYGAGPVTTDSKSECGWVCVVYLCFLIGDSEI